MEEPNNNLDAVFRPRSVAVIGASTVAGKLGHDILYNLIHAGFPGPIYPINPKADQVLELPALQADRRRSQPAGSGRGGHSGPGRGRGH